MEILECKRCGEVWCYHGTGRALRCGKCKSPYWDRERISGEKPRGGSGGRNQNDDGGRSRSRKTEKAGGSGDGTGVSVLPKPRVLRSDYLRCNPCGVNWLMEEMHLPNYLNRNPSAARSEAARTTVGAARCSATPSMGDVDGKQ